MSLYVDNDVEADISTSRGNIRYYLGAQVDVSGLLKNCSGLESLAALVEKQRSTQPAQQQEETKPSSAIKSLSEMLSGEELDIIRTNGGLLKNRNNGHELQNTSSHKAAAGPARVLLADGSDDSDQGEFEAEPDDRPPVPPKNPATEDILTELNLRGVYKHVSQPTPTPHHSESMPTRDPLVPHHPPSPLSPHPIRLSHPPRPKHAPIPLPPPHRRSPHAQRSRRFFPRTKSRHGQSALVEDSE